MLQSLHAFATRVRPDVLDDLGVVNAIESHVAEFRQRTGISTALELDLDSQVIPVDVADHVYRLVQESLNNVAKHAEATHVNVSLVSVHSRLQRRQLDIQITDDGCGYSNQPEQGNRLGLVGMQERVELLSGRFQIESTPNVGTCVRISIPLESQLSSLDGYYQEV